VTNVDDIRGQWITFTHTVTDLSHTSGLSHTFTIMVDNSDGWPVLPVSLPITLTSGSSLQFTVAVSVPSNLSGGVYNRSVVTVRSTANSGVTDNAVDLIANPGVKLSPSYTQEGLPGEVLTYTHILTNTGPTTDTFWLTITSPLNWGQVAVPAGLTVTVGPLQDTPVLVVVQIPKSARAYLSDLMLLTAASTIHNGISATITNSTTAKPISGDRYVATAGQNTNNNCTQPLQPCRTVDYAVYQATWGDMIMVAQGTYPLTDELRINQKISLLGGYLFNSGSGFSRPLPIDPAKTVIDAQNRSRVLHLNVAAGVRPLVDGFTLRNGANPGGPGGAVYLEGSSSPTLTRVVIANSSAGDGGGLYVGDGQLVFQQLTITNTSATNRAGASSSATAASCSRTRPFRIPGRPMGPACTWPPARSGLRPAPYSAAARPRPAAASTCKPAASPASSLPWPATAPAARAAAPTWPAAAWSSPRAR